MRVLSTHPLRVVRDPIAHALSQLFRLVNIIEELDQNQVFETAIRERPRLLVLSHGLLVREGAPKIAELRARIPNTAMLVVLNRHARLETTQMAGVGTFLSVGETDFIDEPIVHDLVVHRLRGLLGAGEPHSDHAETLANLCDPASGRLDARRMAAALGLTMRDLAAAIGRPYTAVQRTPAAKSLQEPLHAVRDVIEAMLVENRTAFGMRRWLNSPRSDLGGASPLDAIRSGRWDPREPYGAQLTTAPAIDQPS
jgi:hypothetical protein